MGAELRLYTGCMGERDKVMVDSFDENNVPYTDTIEIIMEPQDKPRTMTIRVNGRVVFQRRAQNVVFA